MPDLTRAARLEEALAERGLDVLLVGDLVDVRYLTGFTGSAGLALVGPDVRRFVTDFRYLSQSADQLDPAWDRRIETDGLKAAAASLGEGPLKLGFDDAKVTVRQHARLRELLPDAVELVAAGGVVEELRLVKDAEELEKLRAAAALADEALTEVLGRGLAGRTERDVALDLEFAMRRRGASGASFPSIVASGEHGALPHAEPRDVVIPEGVLVTIDWGCVLDGYNSDCTRTYATGDLDPRDREVYELVLQAQLAALEAVRPGPTGKQVDAVARDIIDGAGHAEHFGHGLGHGVGLEVHEGPRLSKQGEVALAPGHVVTVEPGVYVPGATGVRIEDLAVVTEDGHEVLSHLPKELQVIAAAS
jgi:Xaa-Pro aminopeptidase